MRGSTVHPEITVFFWWPWVNTVFTMMLTLTWVKLLRVGSAMPRFMWEFQHLYIHKYITPICMILSGKMSYPLSFQVPGSLTLKRRYNTIYQNCHWYYWCREDLNNSIQIISHSKDMLCSSNDIHYLLPVDWLRLGVDRTRSWFCMRLVTWCCTNGDNEQTWQRDSRDTVSGRLHLVCEFLTLEPQI